MPRRYSMNFRKELMDGGKNPSHRTLYIYIWYIYLHDWLTFYGKLGGIYIHYIYHTWILWAKNGWVDLNWFLDLLDFTGWWSNSWSRLARKSPTGPTDPDNFPEYLIARSQLRGPLVYISGIYCHLGEYMPPTTKKKGNRNQKQPLMVRSHMQFFMVPEVKAPKLLKDSCIFPDVGSRRRPEGVLQQHPWWWWIFPRSLGDLWMDDCWMDADGEIHTFKWSTWRFEEICLVFVSRVSILN